MIVLALFTNLSFRIAKFLAPIKVIWTVSYRLKTSNFTDRKLWFATSSLRWTNWKKLFLRKSVLHTTFHKFRIWKNDSKDVTNKRRKTQTQNINLTKLGRVYRRKCSYLWNVVIVDVPFMNNSLAHVQAHVSDYQWTNSMCCGLKELERRNEWATSDERLTQTVFLPQREEEKETERGGGEEVERSNIVIGCCSSITLNTPTCSLELFIWGRAVMGLSEHCFWITQQSLTDFDWL